MRLGQDRIDDQVVDRRVEARRSIARRSSSGAPVAQACGLHAVGYSTGNCVVPRVAGERLGRRVEALGRLEDADGDAGRLPRDSRTDAGRAR